MPTYLKKEDSTLLIIESFREGRNFRCTVKLGDKEQIVVKEPFPVTNLPFTS